MKKSVMRRCHTCDSIWIEGCDPKDRAYWCEECKRPCDYTVEVGYPVRLNNNIANSFLR